MRSVSNGTDERLAAARSPKRPRPTRAALIANLQKRLSSTRRSRRRVRRPAPIPRLAPSIKLLSAIVALVLGGSSPALAGPALVTNQYGLAGERSELALDGSTTLVGGYESETTNVVRAFTPGQAPKTIARATIKPESGEFGDSMYFVASPSRLVMLDHGRSFSYKGEGEIRYEHLLTGPLEGHLSELPNTCSITPTLDPGVTGEAGIPARSAIAIDGELIGYDSYGCLILQDYATGLKRVVALQATLDPVVSGTLQRLTEATTLRIAGRLVAYRDNPPGGEGAASVVVYDFDTGEQLYRVALPEGAPTFDLEPDGTLVIADPSSCEATVSTISTPTPVPLGVPACKVRRVTSGRALLVVPSDDDHETLAWTSLRTPTLHPVEDLGKQGLLENVPAEMNETEVVYTQADCWDANIYRTSLTEPGAPPPAPATCPVAVSPRVATLTSKTLRVRLHCPLGCSGNLDAHIGTAKQVRTENGGQSIIGIGLPNVSIAPGGYETQTLLPGEAGEESPSPNKLVRRLRHKQRLYLRLDFDIDTPTTYGSEGVRTYPHIVVPIHLAPTPHVRARSRR